MIVDTPGHNGTRRDRATELRAYLRAAPNRASLLVLPWSNAFSRWRERRADAFALRTTGNRDAFIGAMEKLAAQNLAQRRPHPWIELIFHSHPSVEKRIAFAQSWKA